VKVREFLVQMSDWGRRLGLYQPIFRLQYGGYKIRQFIAYLSIFLTSCDVKLMKMVLAI